MSNISTYASNKILDFLLGRESVTVPSNFYIALSTTPLGADGSGLTEPTDPSYSRITIANNKINFSVADNKTIMIIKEFTFETTTEDWGVVTHYAMFDGANNVWFYGELQNSRDVEIDTSPIMFAYESSFVLDINGGSTTDMAMTSNASHKILNHFFGQTPALILPENYYIGVSSTPVSIEGIGMTEPNSAAYERLVIPNDKNSFTFADNKIINIAQEFRFNTADVAWGNMTHYFISDAATGGNIWWSGKLIHSRNVEISTTLVIKPEGFKWVLNNVA